MHHTLLLTTVIATTLNPNDTYEDKHFNHCLFPLPYNDHIDLWDEVVLLPKTFRYNLYIRIRPFMSPLLPEQFFVLLAGVL
jgi:hypothetical protein